MDPVRSSSERYWSGWEGGASEPLEEAHPDGLEAALTGLAVDQARLGRDERRVVQELAARRSRDAHDQRLAAAEEQRDAARDAYRSALIGAVVGISAAVVQAAAAGMQYQSAQAGAPGGEDLALGSKLLGGVGSAAEGCRAAIDPFDDAAAEHQARVTERTAEAERRGQRAGQAWQDAEAARSARLAQLEGASRTLEALERGRTVAIGRESA